MSTPVLNYAAAPTQYLEIEGIRYAYRSLGRKEGTPIVCLQHLQEPWTIGIPSLSMAWQRKGLL